MQTELARAQALLSKNPPNPDKAIKTLRPLMKRENKSWMLYHYMGVAMLQKADYLKARDYLLRAKDAGGNEPETYHLISVAYYNTGDFEQAVRFGNEAINKKRDFLEAWINLGAAHRAMANLDGAMKAYSEANQLDPKNAGIAYRIGSIYFDQGDLKKARELYEITVKMEPTFIEAYLGQALIHLKVQEFPDAVAKIKEALEIDPNNRLSRIQLAVAYKDWGKYTDAIALNEQLLRENPKDGRLRINYALCLLEVGRFNDAEENYLRALKDSPDAPESLSNYLMGIHYNPERTKDEIFDAHLLWDEHFAPEERNKRPIPLNIDPNKKLKIGFISGGFRKHPVGWMITRAIENLPKDQFEVYGYNTHSMYDSLTMRIRKRCDKWTSVLGYTDKIVAKLIMEDEIDILVELSGHSAFNRLKTVALEPVPITIKWVGGLFNTTGLQSMDYLLTDNYESPVGEESYYTEKLVRMPDDYVCYEPPEYEIPVGNLPAHYKGYVTFGCFNNPSKLNDQLIEQWSDILHQVPGSKLFLKSKQYNTQSFVDQVTDMFTKNGIEKERIIFEGYAMHEDLLASYNQVDVALDPWPYSGGLTTCEALWMGVPVVTCAGPTFAGRHSVTHLSNSGNADWVTETWDDYKSKVIELVSDLDELQKIRAGLRDKLLMSPLCDGSRFGAHLSIAFREMWKQRIEGYKQNLPEGDWQDHISVEVLSDEELNKFYEEHNVPKEPAYLLDYKDFELSSDTTLALPKSKENLTHYNLIEKGNSSETLERVLDKILNEGDSAIEVGAGYGTLTVALAKMVGQTGSVYTLEPNKEVALYLKETRRINNLHQVELLEIAASNNQGNSYLELGSVEEHSVLNNDTGTMLIETTAIDTIVSEQGVTQVKLLLIDTAGAWNDIINGSNSVLSRQNPVLCIGNYDGFSVATLESAKLNGYQLFEHIEEVGVLSRLEEGQESTAKWIFALTPEWVDHLTSEGFIFVNEEFNSSFQISYLDAVQYEPWVQNFKPVWIDAPEGEAEENYFNAINRLWEVDQNFELTPSQKAFLSVEAATDLLDLYSANPGNIPVVCSLSRAFLNIGKQKDAATILKSAFQQLITSETAVDLSLPFLLPLKQQEKGLIHSDPINWLKVKIAEAWILLQQDSTYFLESKEVKLLKQLNGNPDALAIIPTIAEELLANGEMEIKEAPSRKPAGKFIHIVFNHIYGQSLNDLLVYTNEQSDQEHHLFLEKHTAIEGFFVDYSDNSNVNVFDFQHDLARIKKECLASVVDAVFFHGIFLDWQKKLAKHIGLKKHVNWVIWGGDLYNPIKFGKPMRFLTGLIDAIHTLAEGDVKLFKDTYGEKQTYELGYLYPGLYGEQKPTVEKQNPPLIIVGNSGDSGNKHVEILEILSKKSDIQDYRLLIPAAYNLKDAYEIELLETIKKLGLEGITTLQKEFIKPEEYLNTIANASIFIGAHNRQQAVGNILGSIYGGNSTFIKKNITIQGKQRENPSWSFLRKFGFEIQDYEVLKSVSALSELPKVSDEQRKKQQQIIHDEFGMEKRSNQLIDASNRILEQVRSTQQILVESR
jgi:FkbM family methyltransferase